MSSKEKSKFEELAKTDKIRYDQEMQSYVPPKGSKVSKKKKKDPNAPKRPPWVMAMYGAKTRMFSHVLIVISPPPQFCLFCVLFRPPAQDQGGPPWHLYWRHRKEAWGTVVNTES